MNPISTKRRFPREVRVRRSAEFDLAFAKGRRVSTQEALLVVRKNDLEITRLGLSVGRKFGNAVARNRAKRLLRESFRLDRGLLPSGFDLIVVPRKPGFPQGLAGVRALLKRLIERGTGLKVMDPGAT